MVYYTKITKRFINLKMIIKIMMKIAKNRYLDALLKLILLSAIVHLVLLAILVFINKDITILNYFNVIDLDLFFPNIAHGILSQVLSAAAMAVLYLILFRFCTKRSA